MQNTVVAQWAAGALKLSTEDEARGRLLVVRDMISLRLPDIYEFYHGEST